MSELNYNDRELLELAAKAAGMQISSHIGVRHDYFADDTTGKEWNPLTDDGDALRLAVKLKMCVISTSDNDRPMTMATVDPGWNEAYLDYIEWHDSDPLAATRRAIVRAAACIGAKP